MKIRSASWTLLSVIGLSATMINRDPVPVILTGDFIKSANIFAKFKARTWELTVKSLQSDVSRRLSCQCQPLCFIGVKLARSLPQRKTKPIFGQSTKTSINLDTSGFLWTLFMVGKKRFWWNIPYLSSCMIINEKYFEILHMKSRLDKMMGGRGRIVWRKTYLTVMREKCKYFHILKIFFLQFRC